MSFQRAFFFLFTSWNVLYVLSIPRHRNKFRKFSKKTHEKMSLKTRVNHTTEWATIRHLPELWEEGISSRILKSRCVLLSRYSHLYTKPICLCKLKSLNSVVKKGKSWSWLRVLKKMLLEPIKTVSSFLSYGGSFRYIAWYRLSRC